MSLDDIFKAYDIRGAVPQDLNEDIAYKVGKALADFLPKDGAVAVGRDMRPDSAALAKAVARGLTEQGREVWDIGQVTSDMIYFACGYFKLAGGAMVTASHNPGKDNGIKLCQEMAKPIGEETGLQDIKGKVANAKFKTAANQPAAIFQKDIIQQWLKHALSFVDVSKWPKYNIAVDAGNGMAGAIIPKLEQKLPIQITPLYFKLDGTFPNHEANPLKAETLNVLIKTIKDKQLDFGLAFDGDGDRAVLVDETGQPLSGTVTTAIIAEATLANNPGATILFNAICGRIVPETITANGGKPVRTKVGHSFIKADMRKHDAPFAGEHSGHYYFKQNFSADSGLIAALMAIDVLAASGKKLSELAGKYHKYQQSGEINFEVADKEAMMKRVATQFKDGKQDDLDGLSVNYDDWWFNLRPSNTEPLLRLNIEASDPAILDAKLVEIKGIIEA